MAVNYTIDTIGQFSQEYNAFINAYNVASTALSNVISTGTIIYQDNNGQAIFPNTFNTFKQYLVQLNSAIQTFIASLPARPSLNG